MDASFEFISFTATHDGLALFTTKLCTNMCSLLPFKDGMDFTAFSTILDFNLQFEEELCLCHGFLAPPFMDYSGYHQYIDEHLPPENSTLYGLHPNTELECLTVTSDNLLRSLLELQPQDSSRREGAADSTEEKVCRQKEPKCVDLRT